MAFDAPGRQAMVVELVGRKNLFNAITLNSLAFNASRFVGPVAAGILIAVVGMSGCFYINAITFLAPIFALVIIKNSDPLRANNVNHAALDIKQGIIYVVQNRVILLLMLMVALVSLFGTSYVLLMPVVAKDVLKIGIEKMGLLMSALGLGSLISALVLARSGDFPDKEKLLLCAGAVFSLSLTGFSLSRQFFPAFIFLFFLGVAGLIVVICVNYPVTVEYAGYISRKGDEFLHDLPHRFCACRQSTLRRPC